MIDDDRPPRSAEGPASSTKPRKRSNRPRRPSAQPRSESRTRLTPADVRALRSIA
jgi:hypothetical protein